MNRQSGLTLIEVLIAVLVLAIGLLGIAGLQSSALSNNFTSVQYSQATNFAQGMIERMRANRQAAVSQLYVYAAGSPAAAPPSPATNCASTACSSSDQAAWDLAVWFYSVAGGTPSANVPAQAVSTLSGGETSIACLNNPTTAKCDSGSAYLVTVYWNADRDPSVTGLNCNPATSTDLRCVRLVYQP